MINLIDKNNIIKEKRWLVKFTKDGRIKEVLIPYLPSKKEKEKMINDYEMMDLYEKDKKLKQ